MTALDPSAPLFRCPDRDVWLANPGLTQVRANNFELKAGAKDPATGGPVEVLQQALRYWGARHRNPPTDLLPKYGTDRHFGAETKAALVEFQKANSDVAGQPLEPDGILGDLSLGALEKYVLMPPTAPTRSVPAPSLNTLTISVDFVPLPGGIGLRPVPEFLGVANEVFAPIGIQIALGELVRPDIGERIARTTLYCNRNSRTDVGVPARGAIRSETIDLETKVQHLPPSSPALELLHLTSNPIRIANPRRATVYLTDLFPTLGVMGTTKTDKVNGVAPTILLQKSMYVADVFWHELAHALLDSETEDHESGTFLERIADPANRKKRITEGQKKRMRATAWAWMWG